MDAVLLKTPQLVYALREGKLVSVDDVESGLKCGCQCPSCEAPLIARKGKHNQHSFAHASGHGCEYGLETSLHLAAKEILSQTDYIPIWPHNPVPTTIPCSPGQVLSYNR